MPGGDGVVPEGGGLGEDQDVELVVATAPWAACRGGVQSAGGAVRVGVTRRRLAPRPAAADAVRPRPTVAPRGSSTIVARAELSAVREPFPSRVMRVFITNSFVR